MDSVDLASAMGENIDHALGGSAEREIQEPLVCIALFTGSLCPDSYRRRLPHRRQGSQPKP